MNTTVSAVAAAGLAAAVAVAAPAGAAAQSNTTATGISRAMNPAISAHVLVRGGYAQGEGEEPPAADEHASEAAEEDHGHDGHDSGSSVEVTEIELQLSSSVDGYAKADIIVALHAGQLEVEEAYVTLTEMPRSLGARVGRLRLPLGKSSPLHTHQLPFIDRSRTVAVLVGDEGLADTGVELSWLTPLPWFSELTLTVAGGEPAPFGSPGASHLLYAARWRSLWDLGETATLDVGVSAATGHDGEEEAAVLGAADMSVRWRPLEGARAASLLWRTEALGRSLHDDEDAGAYSLIAWQAARRWWLQARYERLGLTGDLEAEQGLSALVAYVPSEFQALRLQYGRRGHVEGSEPDRWEVQLQYGFSVGSHPAHAYW